MHRRTNVHHLVQWACLALLAAAVVACGGPGAASFRLDLDSTEVAAVPGLDLTVEVVAVRTGGFTAPITLSLSGTPDGVVAQFDPSPTASGQSDLTLSVALDTPQGEHVVVVSGEGAGVSANASFTMVVTEPLPLSTVAVDTSLDDDVPTLPPLDDGVPRPLTTLTDDSGVPIHFVTNELMVMTDDDAYLADLIGRYGGTLLLSIDPAASGVGGVSAADASITVAPIHLIRIEPAAADEAAFLDELRALEPGARSDLVFGSDAGLDLLATVAHEAAAGAIVSPNWVSKPGSFTDGSVTEAPVTSDSSSRYTSSNVFDWPYMGSGALGIGVAQAWWALEAAGKMDETVRIAILDGGFLNDADVPDGRQAVSLVAGDAALGSPNPATCGDDPCPWHGTVVTWTAAAVPDNDFGTAGPAGPIAEIVTIHTAIDQASAIQAVLEAVARGADIINMSFGGRVPASSASTVTPFNTITASVRASGVLIFAAAGNDGEDVDATGCYPVGIPPFFVVKCWELAWHKPCENAGVICVGGIGMDTRIKAARSNYGVEDVDIFAPYRVFAPANRTNPGDGVIGVAGGTSMSSPFAAGVAALIWAADRSQSADQVANTLFATAHTTPDPQAPRYVNALGAVTAVLGGVPPTVTIVEPSHGAQVLAGGFVTMSATVNDLEDGLDCCVPTWHSDRDGQIGVGTEILIADLSVGTHEITASATDSDGNVGSDVRTVTAINLPPHVTIAIPTDGATLDSGPMHTFVVEVEDVNEPGGFDCGNVVWTSDHADDPVLTGCKPTVAFDTLGARTWTVVATDVHGATGSAAATIDVVAGPDMWASIIEPAPGAWFWSEDDVILFARVSDAFELPATFEWGVSTDGSVYETVATGDITTTYRATDTPMVPGRTWTTPANLAGKDVYVRFTIDAPNGSATTVIAAPIGVTAIPH